MVQLSTLPVGVRRVIYAAYAVAGLALGAIDVAYGNNDPHWLTTAETVLAFLGTAVGLTAVTHTGTPEQLPTTTTDAGTPAAVTPDAGDTGAAVDEATTAAPRRAESDPATDATVGVVEAPNRQRVDAAAAEADADAVAALPELVTSSVTDPRADLPATNTGAMQIGA